ncbi:MAG: aminoglycoside phosphotransferase family protein [Clostridia bacterium]|nr:aminoglycoside phosphotransferase family protein [Clostridia bacterium]
MPAGELVLNAACALACFTAWRFMLRVYKQILRTGSMRAFALELAAGILALGSYVLICSLAGFAAGPVSACVSFAAACILISLMERVAYYYLFRLARREGHPVLKSILRVLTLADVESGDEGALLHLVLEPAKREHVPINDVQNVVEQFAIRGSVTGITQITKGYINRTYRIETLSDKGHVHKYVLQRINTNVFPDVDALMENFKFTTDHLHGKLTLPASTRKGAVQTLRPTKDGRAYLTCDSGCWRMLNYIDDVYSLDIPDSPETFYQAGKAFGRFLREMSDVKTEDIRTIIPDFHNTRSRFGQLEKAIQADPKGRVKEVEKEIAFVRARAGNFGVITDALESGKLPTRICHNDCNLNNILFDEKNHLPVAIIDLDTVMPSSPLYDFGDSMRIGTNTATDDEKDLSKVSCDLNLYEKYARGYLEECGSILTKEELQLLPLASLVITSEDGIRFLMDHINGDTYYNIFYPGQNLDRSRTQLALLADMEKKLGSIVGILQKIYDDLKLDVRLDEGGILKKWKT